MLPLRHTGECGLRDYGLPPIIWDDPGDCEHIWGDEAGLNRSGRDDDFWGGKEYLTADKERIKPQQGQFCQLCGAWRGSLGLEPTPELYIKHVVDIFREVRRVLRKDGTLWLNMGDSYNGSGGAGGAGGDYNQGGLKEGQPKYGPKFTNILKPKDLCAIPWRLALALQADGWWLRSGIPWLKRTAMPESVDDRPSSALEYVFLLTKSAKYFYDKIAISVQASPDSYMRYARGRSDNYKWSDGGPGNQTIAKSMKHMTPGVTPKSAPVGSGIKANKSFHAAIGGLVDFRNFRNTDLFFESLTPPFGAIFADDEFVGLDINPKGFAAAHFATFPPRLPEIAILAGTSEKGCCVKCGSPWERVVEKRAPELRSVKSEYPGQHTIAAQKYKHNKSGAETKTIGWQPTCKHYGTEPLPKHPIIGDYIEDDPYKDLFTLQKIDPVRFRRQTLLDLWKKLPVKTCVVCDIFGGAMTTAIVAHKYGRKFIMIELSKPYIDDIGIPRIEQETIQRKLF